MMRDEEGMNELEGVPDLPKCADATWLVQKSIIILGTIADFSGWNVHVGPQIGMAPESLWGLPNLEY